METILVHAIDGTSVWVPVIAKRLNDSHYLAECGNPFYSHYSFSGSNIILIFS